MKTRTIEALRCEGCGCRQESHPVDQFLSERYGELTLGACTDCQQCEFYDTDGGYDDEDNWDS